MFERYTERARRSLFFARFESSQVGSLSIAPEHLLAGVLREPSPILDTLLSAQSISLDDVRTALVERMPTHTAVSTSVEIPFNAGAKHVLQHAADEADRLQHAHIGPEHLLLGLLREEQSTAAAVLADHGLSLDQTRQRIDEITRAIGSVDEAGGVIGTGACTLRVRSAAFDEYVALIKQRVVELETADDAAARRELVDQILTALDSLQDRV